MTMFKTLVGAVGLVIPAGLSGCASVGGSDADASPIHIGDSVLTCTQIGSEIAHENTVISSANVAAGAAGTGSAGGLLNRGGNGSPTAQTTADSNQFTPGSSGESAEQRAADETGTGAVARANALIDLGKQKKCFK